MAKWLIFIFGVLGCCWQVTGTNKYDNYTLLQITPRNDRQLKDLLEFFSVHSDQVDVFKISHGLGDATDVLVSPRKRHAVLKFANSRLIPIEMINNYGKTLEPKAKKNLKLSLRYNVFDYNSYDAMLNHIQTLYKNNPKLVQLETAGNSYEGRKMTLVKISANHNARNPIIFIDAGIHAREWAAPALAMYIIDRLANGAKNELSGVDWYILPLLNPDGYEYSRKHNRMWRKTRSNTTEKGCFGVDLNRNFGFKWGVSGSSFNPCNEQTFAGPGPFSEPESRVVQKILKKYSNRIKMYVTIHTYGNYLLYPWNYADVLPHGWEKLNTLAGLFSKTVVEAGGDPLQVMSGAQMYPSAGASDDYALGAIKIPYAYTLEMTNGHEFSFPANLLRTVMSQYFEGFKVFGQKIKEEFGNEKLHNVAIKSHLNDRSLECALGGLG